MFVKETPSNHGADSISHKNMDKLFKLNYATKFHILIDYLYPYKEIDPSGGETGILQVNYVNTMVPDALASPGHQQPWHWLCANDVDGSSCFPPLQWRHNGYNGISNHQPHHCLLNCLFRCRSKKTSKLCVTGLCEGNSPVTGEFPAQMASDTENVFI